MGEPTLSETFIGFASGSAHEMIAQEYAHSKQDPLLGLEAFRK